MGEMNESEVMKINGFYRFIQKKHFIVTSISSSPWQFRTPDPHKNVTYSGITFDILNALAESLNFDYEVKKSPDGEFGAIKDNGEWSGLIGQLKEKEADFGAAQISVTRNRSDVVDFMIPFWQESQTFIIKMPTEDKILLYANLFKVNVWCSIILTVIVAAFTTKCLDTLYNHMFKDNDKANTSPYFLRIFGHLLAQGNNQPPEKTTTRVFISCYWFFIITVLAIYSGNLIAFTATKRLKFPIENLEQLAVNPDYQAGVIAGSSTSTLFQLAKRGVLKEVWDNNINVNTANFYDVSEASANEAIRRVKTENFVFIGDFTFWYHKLRTHGHCDVTFARATFYEYMFAFPTYKGFPYLEMFNRKILRMVDTGLILKWRKKHLPRENVCDPKLSSINHNKTTFENTLGGFIALLMGLTFSIVVFVLELIIAKVFKFPKFGKFGNSGKSVCWGI